MPSAKTDHFAHGLLFLDPPQGVLFEIRTTQMIWMDRTVIMEYGLNVSSHPHSSSKDPVTAYQIGKMDENQTESEEIW